MNVLSKVVLLALLSATASQVLASTFDGTIDEVVIGPSPTQSGYIRIGVIVAAHGSLCDNPFAFGYEFSNNNIVGKTWIAAFMAAKVSGQRVHVNGTGTCDQYDVEYIYSMHLTN